MFISEVKILYYQLCPRSRWSEWSICSVTCGQGVQSRHRACNNPEPAYGGLLCTGYPDETISCNEDPCLGEKDNKFRIKIQCVRKFRSHLMLRLVLRVVGLVGVDSLFSNMWTRNETTPSEMHF